MRYIDADYAVQVLNALGNREYRRQNGTIMDAVKALMNEDIIPTVEFEGATTPAGVQEDRGEAYWNITEQEFGVVNGKVKEECSNCGRVIKRREQTPQENYCPKCGCRMKPLNEIDPEHNEEIPV